MKRPTIADLARTAGLSTATVDRVLNGRLNVREETVRRVHEAAEEIGYHGANAIRHRLLADKPLFRLGLVLQKPRHAFYQEVLRVFEAQARACHQRRVQLTVRFLEGARPDELAEILRGFRGRADAVAATGLDHHLVTQAVQDLRAAGVPVYALLSDFAQGVRESYFGTNNLKMGRIAGWFISRLAGQPGKVGLFVGGPRFHGHELRETGFRSYFRDAAPEFHLLDTQINLETRELTYQATMKLIAQHEDLTGIYVAGGGMEGAIQAVRESRAGSRLVLIVNELTPESQSGLQDQSVSVVLATPVRQLAADLIALMIATSEKGMAETPGQRFFPAEIWTPESEFMMQ
ncbi:LacI family transcriptional regulator [Paracoccus halophilus]|uniref:LacI family transcriptional regulator n=1 Tax=Paracoccus halophilus TaxID=376733 RepID=A0A099F8C8_9RHOB|nr:LacI family DNA-binding transcriptional regulator [Paracoccus halophilus]KGJ06463.1 LacI family transcriptional regulator [Paracoccus halophilus]SFA38162.1 LacI family transcriptional regulator [Paracoccus halophilus]